MRLKVAGWHTRASGKPRSEGTARGSEGSPEGSQGLPEAPRTPQGVLIKAKIGLNGQLDSLVRGLPSDFQGLPS